VQAEGADPKLVLAARYAERCLELVLLATAEPRESIFEIKHREEASASSLVDELLDMLQLLRRALRYGVEATEILTELPCAVRLASEHDRCSVGSTRGHYPALVKQVCHLLAALIELARQPSLHRPRAPRRHRVRACLDAQLELLTTVRRKTLGRTAEHVAELGCKRGELWGVTCIGRERERGPLCGEGNAADEELSTVG
jgi:hypothetical protein